MLYLIPIIVIFNSDNHHAIFNSNNFHAIFNFDNCHSDNCHAIFNSNSCRAIFNYDNCHAIFDSGIYHAIVDTDIWHATLDPWHLTLALGIYTGTRYVDPVLEMWHTWHLHLTHSIWYAFMWYKYLDLTSWPLTGHYYPWYLYLYDIFMTITFTGTWHDYYIITRHLVLLNSCTPVL